MGFLDRLAGEREETAQESVARNLTAVLNSRKQHAGIIEVFGLGDYDEHLATRPLLEMLTKEMMEAIKAFEPRARKPELTYMGRESTLFAAFRLRCEIEGRPAGFWIRMQTILRYVTVEPIPPGPPGEGTAR
jgi:predicted component of type VI protein secretion system